MLTALDYLEIEQLVYRYGYALDTGADNGFAYADLYAPDGDFHRNQSRPERSDYQGRERLAALARGGKRGPNFVSHYVTNVVVEPAPGGAVGRTYVGILEIGNGGNRRDEQGRPRRSLQRRLRQDAARVALQIAHVYFESTSGAPVQPPPAALGVPRRADGIGRQFTSRAGSGHER